MKVFNEMENFMVGVDSYEYLLSSSKKSLNSSGLHYAVRFPKGVDGR